MLSWGGGGGGGITSAGIDTAFGSTRGSLLERGAAGWALLIPVGANRILVDNGVGADPSWKTLTSELDSISSTRGDIHVRGAATWGQLAVGNAGQFIAGGTDPSYSSTLTPDVSSGGTILTLNTSGSPGSNAVTGVKINIPATTRSSTVGESALAIESLATSAFLLGARFANTSQTIFYFAPITSITLVGGLLGFDLNLNQSGANIVTPGTNNVSGMQVTIPATTATDSAFTGAFVCNSFATKQRVMDIACANTQGTLAFLRYGTSTTLAGAMTGLAVDLKTNVIPTSQVVTGVTITIPAGANASYASVGQVITRSGTAITANQTWSGNLINLQNTPTGGSGGVVLTESGVLVNVNHAPVAGGTAIVDNTIGIRATLTPSTASSTGLRGLDLLFGANVTGGTLANISWNGASTISAATTLLNLDGSTNITPGSQQIKGIVVTIPASSSASTTGIAINSTSTNSSSGMAIAMNPGGSNAVNALNLTMTTGNSSSVALNIVNNSTGVAALVTDAGNAGSGVRGLQLSMTSSNAYTAEGFCFFAIRNVNVVSESASMGLIQRSSATAGAATISGPFLWLRNIPVSGSGVLTQSENILQISNIPTVTSGTVTDSTNGIAITHTPTAGNTATLGITFFIANFTQTFTGSTGFNTGSASTAATPTGWHQIIHKPSWTPGAAVTLTLQKPLLDIVSAPQTGNSSATITDSGPLVNIVNAPTTNASANTYTDSKILLNIVHIPTKGAGSTYTDTTIGMTIAMTPAASAAVKGIVVTMGANATGAGLTITGGGALSFGVKVGTYNAIATAGWGQPAIYAVNRQTGLTGAVSATTIYTVGAADGSFIISTNINVTAIAVGIQSQLLYTDETNTAQTITFNLSTVTGTLGLTAAATGAYEGLPLHIRAKAATVIQIQTAYTSGTYNIEWVLQQIQ